MFNKRLRQTRMKCGFTQQNMADKLGISLNAYQKSEQGEITWNNCSPNVNLPTRKPPIPPNCMPAAPSALRRKWAKKAWKPHWQRQYMTALS